MEASEAECDVPTGPGERPRLVEALLFERSRRFCCTSVVDVIDVCDLMLGLVRDDVRLQALTSGTVVRS